MTVDPMVFTAEIQMLMSRFDRKFNEEQKGRWYEYFDARLTDSEFRYGCRRAADELQFFPAPAQIVAFAKPTSATDADEAWEGVMLRLTGGQDILTEPGSLERRTLSRLGVTSNELRTTDAKTKSFLRPQFIEVYLRLREAQERESGIQALESGNWRELPVTVAVKTEKAVASVAPLYREPVTPPVPDAPTGLSEPAQKFLAAHTSRRQS